MNHFDAATNLAFFLLERKGSVLGCWDGRMPAVEQRKLFGRFLGKGSLRIDGDKEEIIHSRKVCFGLDYEDTHYSWHKLGAATF